MHKKLTITLDERVYQGLYTTVGVGKISQFIEKLLEPHVTQTNLAAAYAAMAADEVREAEANAWIEGVIEDVSNAAR